MKTNMKNRKNSDLAFIALSVMILLWLFTQIISMSLWNKFVQKPLTTEQFQYLETVAQDVYNQGNLATVEAPDDVRITKTGTFIRVEYDDMFVKGSVTGKVENNKNFITLREINDQRSYAYSTSGCFGLLIATLCFFIEVLIFERIIHKKANNK